MECLAEVGDPEVWKVGIREENESKVEMREESLVFHLLRRQVSRRHCILVPA